MVKAAACGVGGVFEIKRLVGVHRFLVHPNDGGFEMSADVRTVGQLLGRSGVLRHVFRAFNDHLAARNVDFILQLQGYALGRESIVEVAVVSHDALHATRLSAG